MKITLDAGGKGKIPAKTGRESYSVTLLSGSAVWAHESNVTTGGATQGQPLTIGQTIHFIAPGGGNRVFAKALYFAGSAGAELIYTQTPADAPA